MSSSSKIISSYYDSFGHLLLLWTLPIFKSKHIFPCFLTLGSNIIWHIQNTIKCKINAFSIGLILFDTNNIFKFNIMSQWHNIKFGKKLGVIVSFLYFYLKYMKVVKKIWFLFKKIKKNVNVILKNTIWSLYLLLFYVIVVIF